MEEAEPLPQRQSADGKPLQAWRVRVRDARKILMYDYPRRIAQVRTEWNVLITYYVTGLVD